MQEATPLEKNDNFLRLLEEKLPSRRSITIRDVEKIGGGWETELYSFEMEYKEKGQRRRHEMVVRIFPGKNAERKSKMEFTVMKGLQGAGFPVPEVYLLEVESSVLGKPFLVMERIRGRVMTDLLTELSEDGRRDLLTLFCELFVDLHNLDWRRVLPDSAHGEPDDPYDFVDRKLGDMQVAIERFRRAELNPVLRWLQARKGAVPCERQSVLHLDYHPDNVIVREDGSAVVIDWGAADIGDPRSDLAWTLMLSGTFLSPAIRDAILNTYEELSAKKIQNVEYFEVMAVLRRLLDLAVSLAGGAENRGMRPGAEEQMRKNSEHYMRVYDLLKERTGIKIPEIEGLINSLI